jgi:Fe2+ or Zn2+ uptake regulation protein
VSEHIHNPSNGGQSVRLRAAGLAVTRPRVMVLDCLGDQEGHLAVDDIADLLRGAGSELPRASIYNVVRDLVAAGLVMQADVGPGRALYEVADTWHHHFVCRACGRVVDVPCTEGRKPCLDVGLPGLEVDEAQVIFRGLCPTCTS